MKIKWQFAGRDIKWAGDGIYVYLPKNQVWIRPASLVELEIFAANGRQFGYIAKSDLYLIEDN